MITGTITGQVVDPSGLAIAAANVKVIQESSGFERSTSTDDTGAFTFASVVPGEHKLTIQQNGFKSLERRNLNLTA